MRKALVSLVVFGICTGAAMAKPEMQPKQQPTTAMAAAHKLIRPHAVAARWDPCKPNGPDYYCQ